MKPATDQALQYSYSGQRFLLGYGADFYGIWDRGSLVAPVRRYPRTADGWRDAWLEFSSWEPNAAEVGLTSAAPSGPGYASGYSAATGYGAATGTPSPWDEQPRARASGWWWTMPILFSLLGGIVAWAANKEKDPASARNFLIAGFVMLAVNLALWKMNGGRLPGT